MRFAPVAGLLLVSLTAQAATRYVNVNSPNPQKPFTTKATAARAIGPAVAAAADGDTILVATGRYVLAAPVVVKKGVVIRASGKREQTVVDGNDATRCFTLSHAAARVDGFTITRGRAAVGAGVYQQAGALFNCAVTGNTAIGVEPKGGGVYARGLVRNCDIIGNSCISTSANAYVNYAYGAGIYCAGGVVEDSHIAHNTGVANYVWGGGVYLLGGRLVYTVVRNNSASAIWYAHGGGVCAQYGSEIERCWITGNLAEATEAWIYTTASADGGGIYLGNGSSARNSLVADNTASSPYGFPQGGGAWISGSTLFHCTLYGNQSVGGNRSSKAGGVLWGFSSTCQGSIIWANAANQGPNHAYVLGSGAGEIDFSYTCTDFLPAGAGNRNENPLLVNPASYNFRLSAESPCLDAAKPGATYTVDIDGYPRPLDGDTNGTAIADIGCYEFGDQARPAVCDFDGDGRTDPVVRRAASGALRLLPSQTWRTRTTSAGMVGWKAVVADYDGDGRADPAWFDPATGRWHIYESGNSGKIRLPRPLLGAPKDLPVPADFDGDGRADPAVRRALDGKITVLRSTTGKKWTFSAGNTAWIATPADYDGDGRADPAFYVPGSPGKWRIYESGNAYALKLPLPAGPGGPASLPVVGDFDGDGKTDRAVFNPGTGKYTVRESQSGLAWTSVAGNKAWKPAPGDYDGDGLTDCGWFNPATRRFVVLYSDTHNADNTLNNLATLPAFGAGAKDLPVSYRPGK